MSDTVWIAVDWGTSNLRAWRMDASDRVIDCKSSDTGMSKLSRQDFVPAFERLMGHFEGLIVACGMVGARQGLVEAPYVTVPCKPPDASRAREFGNWRVIPGMKQLEPADVMRGEETQIAGFLDAHQDFDGVLCLPGTHTKWVHVSAGEVVSFRTSMTGEMFAMLSQMSVLRHSVTDGWDDSSFDEAVQEALSRPESLGARLFNIRAETLLKDLDPGIAKARLSGLLIGAELAAMRVYWLGQPVALVGGAGLCRIYDRALRLQGVRSLVADGDQMTLRGLVAAKSALEVT